MRDLGQKKRNAFAGIFEEKRLSVLVEDKNDRTTGLMKGYSDNYIPVLITDGVPDLPHKIVHVMIEKALEGRLSGRTMNNDG